MNLEFITLQLSRNEALELQAALVQRAMLEDLVRREKGLEPVSTRPMIEKIDRLLGLSEGQAEKLAQAVDNDLWEHAWYAFTDEWAWFRATQEVEHELGQKVKAMDKTSFEKQVENHYAKHFEKYIKEIDMKDRKAA